MMFVRFNLKFLLQYICQSICGSGNTPAFILYCIFNRGYIYQTNSVLGEKQPNCLDVIESGQRGQMLLNTLTDASPGFQKLRLFFFFCLS